MNLRLEALSRASLLALGVALIGCAEPNLPDDPEVTEAPDASAAKDAYAPGFADAGFKDGSPSVDASPTGGPCAVRGDARACSGPGAGGASCTGLQRCTATGTGELAPQAWGACECDIVEVAVDIASDCETATCPLSAPHVVGCKVDFQGGDPNGKDQRGCVARTPNPSQLFFKEGNNCGVGRVVGKMFCSTRAGAAIDAVSCPINRKEPIYASSPNGCPK